MEVEKSGEKNVAQEASSKEFIEQLKGMSREQQRRALAEKLREAMVKAQLEEDDDLQEIEARHRTGLRASGGMTQQTTKAVQFDCDKAEARGRLAAFATYAATWIPIYMAHGFLSRLLGGELAMAVSTVAILVASSVLLFIPDRYVVWERRRFRLRNGIDGKN